MFLPKTEKTMTILSRKIRVPRDACRSAKVLLTIVGSAILTTLPARAQTSGNLEKSGNFEAQDFGVWKDATKDDPPGTPFSAWMDGVDTDWRQSAADWQKISVVFPSRNPPTA
jgi:hypothetical protein